MNKYTSLALSKLLAENGFKKESELVRLNGEKEIRHKRQDDLYNPVPVYDILNDICIRYRKEVFGERRVCDNCGKKTLFEDDGRGNKYETCNCNFRGNLGVDLGYDIVNATQEILRLLQQNKKDEAEEYLWSNCLFNPKNKL